MGETGWKGKMTNRFVGIIGEKKGWEAISFKRRGQAGP